MCQLQCVCTLYIWSAVWLAQAALSKRLADMESGTLQLLLLKLRLCVM